MAGLSKTGAITWALTLAGLAHSHGDFIADRDTTSDIIKNKDQILSVPLTRIHQSLMPEIPSRLRARYFQSSVKDIIGAAYLADITVGTGNPDQTIQVLLDTGSYELWVNPNCSKSSVPELCESFGQYDPSLSPTAQNLNATSQIRYGSGSVNISYFTDDVSISSGRISTQQFGVATDSQSVWFGIMGLGYGRRQAGSTKGSLKYDSVIDNIYDQQYTNSRLFGLELGLQGKPQIAVTGQIIFGGVDTNKYAGNLSKIPLEEVDSHYRVKLTSISHQTPGNAASTITETSQIVIVDSGTTLSILPRDVVELIASQFPGATYDGDGTYLVPCALQDEPGSLSFGFDNTVITVPYSEFIWGAGNYNGTDICLLGVQWNTNSNIDAAKSYLILGDTFMRATYTVFDQDNNALYMSNYTTCGTQSSIVAVPAGLDAAANIPGNCEPPTVSEPAMTTATTGTNVTPISTGLFSSGDPNPVGPVSMTPSVSSFTPSSTSTAESGSSSSGVATSEAQQSEMSTPLSTATSEDFAATSSSGGSSPVNSSPSDSTPSSTNPGDISSASGSPIASSSADTTIPQSTDQSTTVGGSDTQTATQTMTAESTTSETPSSSVTSLPDERIIFGVLADGGAAKNGTSKRSTISHGALKLAKRQSNGGFIGGAGPANPSSCSDASGFGLIDGQLVSNDGGGLIATEPGVESMVLRVSPTGGSINTTFAVVDGILHWFNDAFFGGEATFCQTPDGQVNLVFTEDGAPAGCGEVSVAVYSASQCQNGELVLSASSSATGSVTSSITAPSDGITATTTGTSTGAESTGDGVDQFPISPALVTSTNTITTTVTNYIAYTITACPPSVQGCPIGQITTSTQVYVTTICPEDSAPAATTQPPSAGSGGGGAAAADGGNAVAVIVAVTVTEECETSTFAVSTCAANDDDNDCVLGRTTTTTYTRYRTITTTQEAMATATAVGDTSDTTPEMANALPEPSETLLIAPNKGAQIDSGSGFNSSAAVNFACPGCAVNVVPSGSAAFGTPTASFMPVQAGAEMSRVGVVGVFVSAFVGALMLIL
ncbi:hypothetical protein PFICI_03848 [Pestalotiopsis fici W106-1]|uniref:Peptidase A1 domain-containing protein n=1 Tax=Pestalotiopsis fici (strain W106-1 / CGMCC3.15140) TaxID=1229662 RepID=W3XIC9_PESFW|nr:uncharacterized protein PFICI_03848 [Pestalotiopsis fici W106-1]ETS85823.1 hypothetical protein PFICI_03848 [Pestalotiopsis fici W106-1]